MSLLRPFLLGLVLLVLGAGAHAQGAWQYGALGGASLSTQSPGDDVRAGFNVGMYVDYAVLPYAALSLETAFVQKGQTFDGIFEQPGSDDETDEIPGTYTIALDYASFTLAAKPSLPIGDRGMALYAVAGPRLDVLVREKLLFEALDQSLRLSIDEHEATVWGYDAAIGFRLGDVLPTPLIAEIRFSGDLTDAFDGPSRDATRNQVVHLRIGVEF
jgi:hypothetical protein